MGRPMPTDKRQKAIDALTKKIMAGKRLNENDIRDTLYLARDHALLHMTRKIIAGSIVDKASVRVFNTLQNAVERYEITHDKSISDDSITIGYEFELPDKAPKRSDIEA